MSLLDDQFYFALVYLLPLVPAFGLIAVLGRSRFVASAKGSLAGFGVQAGGGFGAYVVLVVLLAFVRQYVAPPTAAAISEFFLEIDGDERAVEKFIGDDARNVQLVVYSKGVPITRLGNFFVSRAGLITTTKDLSASIINGKEQVDLELVGTRGARLMTTKAQAGEHVTAKILVEGDPDKVVIALDAQEITYDIDLIGVHVRHVIIFKNEGDVPASTLDIGPSQAGRPYKSYKSVVRKVTGVDAVRRVSEYANAWSRAGVANKSSDDLANMYEDTWTKIQGIGDAIGRFEKQDWGVRTSDSLSSSNSLELIWGLTPRIRDIPGGLGKGDFVVYILDYAIDGTSNAINAGDNDFSGTLTKYSSEHVVMIGKSLRRKLASDRDAVQVSGAVSNASPNLVYDPVGDFARSIQLDNIPRLTTIGMSLRFQ